MEPAEIKLANKRFFISQNIKTLKTYKIILSSDFFFCSPNLTEVKSNVLNTVKLDPGAILHQRAGSSTISVLFPQTGAAVWVRQCMHHAVTDRTLFAIACVREGMKRGEGGGGGMTNSGQLKPLGLNTIVVAERGHYWKWLCHRGRPCWIAFPPFSRASNDIPLLPLRTHAYTNTHTDGHT